MSQRRQFFRSPARAALILGSVTLWFGCRGLPEPASPSAVPLADAAPVGSLLQSPAPVAWEAPPVPAALAPIASFVTAVARPPSDLRFPHATHIEEAELECVECHATVAEGTSAGRPSKEICADCHDEADPDAEPSDECKLCHLRDDYSVTHRRAPPYLAGGVTFDHSKHIAASLECSACHGAVEAAATLEALQPLPTMRDCWSCHEEREAPRSCATCHSDLTAETRPEFHELSAWRGGHGAIWARARSLPAGSSGRCDLCHEVDTCATCHQATPPADHEDSPAWRGAHGSLVSSSAAKAARCALCHTRQGCEDCHQRTAPATHGTAGWLLGRHGDQGSLAGVGAPQCAVCHGSDGCDRCHQREKPRSHTPFWRNQGHGLDAGISRDKCATCHQADSCVRCHTRVPPVSHTPIFTRPPQATHCVGCHQPVQSASCSACHSQASHLTAPPRPADAPHSAATEASCRSCHGLFSLPHPDNGACTSCHG